MQVKGLSIEHEKLAVAHSHSAMEPSPLDSPTRRKQLKVLKEEADAATATGTPHQSSPSPSSAYSPAMSPYLHHYRPYERAAYEHKRPLRSPSELLQESVRASVLRDGKAAARPSSPMSLAYRPSSGQHEADGPPENRFDPDAATALICPEAKSNDQCQDPGCPEGTRSL